MKIGISSLAHTHALRYVEILRERADIDLLVTDPDHASRPAAESGGRELADRLGVAYVDTLEDLLAWSPDAIVVCSESSRHLADVERAAAAGAHILCEKPLATTAEDARRIVEICDDAGVLLMTAFPVRFTREFVHLRELVRSGALGTVLSISGANNGKVPDSRAWFTDREHAGGGCVTDHTAHVADLVFDLFPDADVEEVYAVANRRLHPEMGVESAGLVSVRYSSGLTAVIDCSWSKSAHHPTWGGLTLRVIGEKAVADLDAFAERVDGFSEARREDFWLAYGRDCNADMVDEFIDAISAGRQPRPSGRDGLRTVELVDAAYRSIDVGLPVTVGARVADGGRAQCAPATR